MRSRSRLVLLVLVVVLAPSVFAAPAQAASVKVVKGTTQMNMDKNVVRNLVGQNVVVDDISPATLSVDWAGGIDWSFRVPIYTGSGGSTYDWSAKTGTIYHDGGIRFVNVSVGPQQTRFQGLRIIANGADSYSLSAAVGTSPAPRRIVARSTSKPKITRSGKRISIEGIQFKLSASTTLVPGGAAVLESVLGLKAGSVSTSLVFFDTDLHFTLK